MTHDGRRVFVFCLGLGLALGFASSPARSEPIEIDAFGHVVQILSPDVFTSRLLLDGREVLRDAIIDLRAVNTVDGFGVIVGETSSGGNACSSAPFVISFPPGDHAPRLDGPLDDCGGAKFSFSGGGIDFTQTPLPGTPGHNWHWTPSNGFTALADTAFVASATRGWTEFRERTATHPSDVLNYAEIATQLYQLLGVRREELLPYLNGVGSGQFQSDFFIATSCVPHSCGYQEAILALDLRHRQVFIAWKPEDAAIEVRPEISRWPSVARTALKDWAKTWP